MFKKVRNDVSSLDAYNYSSNTAMDDTKCMILYEPTPLESFTFEQLKQPDGSVTLMRISDIDMLFNQKRLDKFSSTQIDNMLANLKQNLKAPVGAFTDDELMMFIKSRHIQASADVAMWSDYLVSVADSMNVKLPTEPIPTEPTPTEPTEPS